MEVYLDNSATTKCYDSVCGVVAKTMAEDYGNPSSAHRKGVEAEQYIRWSKEVVARLLKVQEKELYFTSGGTESDNLAIIGAVRGNSREGKHLITSVIEHPAVLNTMHYLEDEEGYRVTYLQVDENGRVSVEELRDALCEETVLVSIMHVNNEIGSVQPIGQIGLVIKEYNYRNQKNVLLHVDAIQGFGKFRIHPKRENIDLLSISGHKIHGPKGSGLLYVGQHVKMKSIFYGGKQQSIRSGTLNVPGIAGFATACKEIYAGFDHKVMRMLELKQYFIEEVSKIQDVKVHTPIHESAPHIISVGFAGIRSEVLLHSLEDKGIYVSAGSACSSNRPGISGVLKSIGLNQKYLDSTLRFSLSEFTTREEIDYTLETLYNYIPMLRRYTRR